MKKWFFLAMAAAFSLSTHALDLTEGKQYLVIEGQQRTAQPEVIEFFYLHCTHCYAFEKQYHIPQKIAAAFPQVTSFKHSHADIFGPQPENHTRARSLALAINAEEKVTRPLFKAVQANVIQTIDDIRKNVI